MGLPEGPPPVGGTGDRPRVGAGVGATATSISGYERAAVPGAVAQKNMDLDAFRWSSMSSLSSPSQAVVDASTAEAEKLVLLAHQSRGESESTSTSTASVATAPTTASTVTTSSTSASSASSSSPSIVSEKQALMSNRSRSANGNGNSNSRGGAGSVASGTTMTTNMTSSSSSLLSSSSSAPGHQLADQDSLVSEKHALLSNRNGRGGAGSVASMSTMTTNLSTFSSSSTAPPPPQLIDHNSIGSEKQALMSNRNGDGTTTTSRSRGGDNANKSGHDNDYYEEENGTKQDIDYYEDKNGTKPDSPAAAAATAAAASTQQEQQFQRPAAAAQPQPPPLPPGKEFLAQGRAVRAGGGILASGNGALYDDEFVGPEFNNVADDNNNIYNNNGGTFGGIGGASGIGIGIRHVDDDHHDDKTMTTAQLVKEEDDVERTIILLEHTHEEVRQQILKDLVDAKELQPEDLVKISQAPPTFVQKYGTILGCLLFTVIVAVVLTVTLLRRGQENQNPSLPLLTGMEYLVELLTPISGKEALLDNTTLQHRAITWLAYDDPAAHTLFQLKQYGGNDTALKDRTEEDSKVNGIRCNSDGAVVRLNLDYNNLTGSIPSELAAVKTLERISVTGNFLSENMPSEMGNMPRLAWLNLGDNYLTGSIPQTFGNLTNLGDVAFFYNALTGSLPPGFVSLGSLKRLYISDNFITGTIPPFHSGGSSFTELSANRNNLTGTLPESLYALVSLEVLSLSVNAFNGTISTKIGNLGKLTSLGCAANGFTGTMPTELGTLTNLVLLGLAENRFSGTLPSELSRLSQLTHLEAYANFLTGTIPTEYGKLTSIFTLTVDANELVGSIPSELGSVESLRFGFLGLSANSFTGSVTNVFCNATLYPGLPPPVGLSADCEELDCPCCTDCCDDATGECIIRMNVICENKKVDFQDDFPAYAGANCTCLDDGYKLSCENTQCEPCSSDGTVCLHNYDYGIDFQNDGVDNLVHCKMRYLSGPYKATDIEYNGDADVQTCTLVLNGTACNFCALASCNDGFVGLRADCSNIEEGALYDDCDPSLTGGELLRFLRPEFMDSDCPTCLANFDDYT